MHLPVRTTLALAALTLFAGTAYATPALEPTLDASLLIAVADDSTSETEAIEMDQNTQPSSPSQDTKKQTPPAASSSSSSDSGEPLENQEYNRETNQ